MQISDNFWILIFLEQVTKQFFKDMRKSYIQFLNIFIYTEIKVFYWND